MGHSPSLTTQQKIRIRAQGFRALFQNTAGARNTVSGCETLISNTTGFENTATGAVSLQSNTTGNDNTATGFAAKWQHNGQVEHSCRRGVFGEQHG
jgi:hypothetical protein